MNLLSGMLRLTPPNSDRSKYHALSFAATRLLVECLLSNARLLDYERKLGIILEDDALAREDTLRVLLR